MPTIQMILDDILGSDAINSVDQQKIAEAKPEPQTHELNENEKMARILEHLSEDIHRIHHTQTEKVASNSLKKMAVGATIVDTLSKIDSSGISSQCFHNHFRES